METLSIAPSPLLLDSLLASSWTWLALCLATLATLLRAVRSSFRRRIAPRLPDQEPTARPASVSPSCAEVSERQLRRRRRRSKSASALEFIQHNPEGFLEFLCDSVVRKVTSASRICDENDLSCKPVCMPGLHTDTTFLGQDLGLGSGFEVSSRDSRSDSESQVSNGKRKTEKSVGCFFSERENEVGEDEDAASCQFSLPEWAMSLCDFVQNSFGFCDSSSSSAAAAFGYGDGCADDEVSSKPNQKLCFEEQFGWESFLHGRLGSSWRCQVEPSLDLWQKPCSNTNFPSQQPDDVVRLWSPPEEKLMQYLKVGEASAMSVDLLSKEGFACFGFGHGHGHGCDEPDAAVWDVSSQTCINSCISSGNSMMPVSALSMNPDAMVTVLGNRNTFGLWEHSRSPDCTMLQTKLTAPLLGLKSRDNAVCVAHANGLFSIYDLRKLDGGNIVDNLESRIPFSKSMSLKPEEDFISFLLEKVSSEDEEEVVDDSFSFGSLDVEKPSSFASFCAGFMRSFSTSTV